MKKTALTLAFLLTLCSFTACGNNDAPAKEAGESSVSSSAEESSEKETSAEDETTEENSEGSEETETTEAEESKSEDKASDDKADSEKSASSDEEGDSQPAAAVNTNFKKGVVENDVYTSEFGGIKLTCPEGWTFAKEDYILSMMNIGLDVMGDDTAITKAMLDQVAIYDAMCMNQSTGTNIIIQYENLAKEVPDPDKCTMDDYFGAIDKMLTSMTNMSYTKSGELETVTLAGKEFQKVVYTAEYSGVTIEQAYYARRIDDFVQAIAFSGTAGDDMASYEKYFEALD